MADELSLIWQQLDALRRTVAELVELQSMALGASQSSTAEPIFAQLDTLGKQLEQQGEELAKHADQSGKPVHLDGIETQCINVVEPDGTLRMVISNRQQAPDGVMDGETFRRSINNRAGIIFYDDEGNECGGLGYSGRREGDHYSASGSLTFDQFKQDEVIGIDHEDNDGQRTAGLFVSDRPDMPLPELIKRMETIFGSPMEEIFKLVQWPKEALAQMQAARLLSARRVFVGKDRQRAAVIRLHDPEGRVRLRLTVNAEGTPRLEFLDEAGQVIESLPRTPEVSGT